MIPTDPVILLSYINTQLRDYYDNLEDMCKSLDIDQGGLCDRLGSIGYEYQETVNQFR